MSTFLKTFFSLVILFICLLNNVLLAQCSINKTIKNDIITAETADRYQYLRTSKQYYGLSIKTVLVKKAQLKTYTIIIKYTGSTLNAQPSNINFSLTDNYILEANLKLVKTQKVDDSKVSTKIYEITLPDGDIDRLKQTPLKQINIILSKKAAPVVITVDDEALIQNQISCLQSVELN